jgi:hypothetical protein
MDCFLYTIMIQVMMNWIYSMGDSIQNGPQWFDKKQNLNRGLNESH